MSWGRRDECGRCHLHDTTTSKRRRSAGLIRGAGWSQTVGHHHVDGAPSRLETARIADALTWLDRRPIPARELFEGMTRKASGVRLTDEDLAGFEWNSMIPRAETGVGPAEMHCSNPNGHCRQAVGVRSQAHLGVPLNL
jgi:hypothetical protein